MIGFVDLFAGIGQKFCQIHCHGAFADAALAGHDDQFVFDLCETVLDDDGVQPSRGGIAAAAFLVGHGKHAPNDVFSVVMTPCLITYHGKR